MPACPCGDVSVFSNAELKSAGTDLPVGVEVGSGDLQSDPVLSLLVELLCDETSLLHQ